MERQGLEVAVGVLDQKVENPKLNYVEGYSQLLVTAALLLKEEIGSKTCQIRLVKISLMTALNPFSLSLSLSLSLVPAYTLYIAHSTHATQMRCRMGEAEL